MPAVEAVKKAREGFKGLFGWIERSPHGLRQRRDRDGEVQGLRPEPDEDDSAVVRGPDRRGLVRARAGRDRRGASGAGPLREALRQRRNGATGVRPEAAAEGGAVRLLQ